MSDSLGLTIRLALRNIMRNKRRTGLMILLVASGLSALIVTDGFTRGMIDVMLKKVTGDWLGDAQVHAPGFREDFDTAFTIQRPGRAAVLLAAEPSVKAFSKRTFSGGMVASSNNVTPGAIIGIEPEREAGVSKLKQNLIEGTWLSSSDTGGILIGDKMAALLEVRLGDRIVTTMSEAGGGELSQVLFRVQGIFDFGDRVMDTEMAFVTLKAGQEMLGIGNAVHEIAIRFDPAADEAATVAAVARLAASFEAEELEFLGWRGLLPDLAGVLELSGTSSYIVGTILFILVSLGLINSMFMSIYERHYEFGVMLGLGTRRRILFALVCWEGSLIGAFGALLGILVGGLGNYWLSQNGLSFGEVEMAGTMLSEPITTKVTLQQLIIFPLFVVALAALACIIPALHGARLVPAIALRRAL
jgi:putative ABC transport system permease protein